jgi:cyclase
MQYRQMAMKTRGFLLALTCFAAPLMAQAQPSSVTPKSFPVVQGKTYKFERVADGVYYASGGFGSNNTVVVNDDDVLIVDTGTTPAAARAFVDDIKTITDKPVRYVVNTHWHYDHTDGNSIFGPEVKIIAHDFVREALTTFDVLHREPFMTSQGTAVPARIAALKKQIAEARDPAQKAALANDLDAAEAVAADLKEIKPTPPNVTYSTKLVLHRGTREIDLLFLGRGHTAGDTVVFLPEERVVATGDLMESRLAYMGDAYFDEWVATLEQLKQLDFDLVLPGHGIPFSDKGLITAYQSYLRDLIAKGDALRRAGVSVEDAAQRIDLTAHAKAFPQIAGPGADIRGMRRLYEWLAERGGA